MDARLELYPNELIATFLFYFRGHLELFEIHIDDVTFILAQNYERVWLYGKIRVLGRVERAVNHVLSQWHSRQIAAS